MIQNKQFYIFSIVLLSAGVFLLATNHMLAQSFDHGAGAHKGKPGLKKFDNLIEQLDTDGDGKISLEEFLNRPDWFSRLDANEDGAVTREEIEIARAARQEERNQRVQEHFNQMDADGDGFLSPEEFKGQERMFVRLDKDEDGKLSLEEFAAAQRRMQRQRVDRRGHRSRRSSGWLRQAMRQNPEEVFKMIDLDGDGFITQDELDSARERLAQQRSPRRRVSSEQLQARFKTMDTNEDDVLSPDEFKGPEEMFVKLDTNKDGSIDLEEFLAGHNRQSRQRRKNRA